MRGLVYWNQQIKVMPEEIWSDSSNILTRLKRNRYVSLESIERICHVMECGVDDILEFVLGEEADNG